LTHYFNAGSQRALFVSGKVVAFGKEGENRGIYVVVVVVVVVVVALRDEATTRERHLLPSFPSLNH